MYTYKLQQLTVNCLPTLDLAARRAEAAAREANIVPGYAVLSTLQKQNMMPFKRTVGLRLWGCDGCERCRLWRARHSAAARVARACGAPLPYLKIILFICTRKLY